jgi:hypothetical protein
VGFGMGGVYVCPHFGETALIRFVLEDRNPLVAMPKLYVFAVHKLPGVPFGFLVIGAPKFVTLQHVSICADNKSAIVLHRLLR